MLLAALREPDPVFLFEHAMLYPEEGEVDEGAGPADIRHAAVRRPGGDVTLITYGGSLGKALRAAEQLAAEGIAGRGHRPASPPSARHCGRPRVRGQDAPRGHRR